MINANLDGFFNTINNGARITQGQGLLLYLGVIILLNITLIRLLFQAFERLMLWNLLFVLGPLAFLFSFLPQTSTVFAFWGRMFVVVTFTQFVQFLAFTLGLALLANAGATWIPIETLQQGITGKSEQRTRVAMTCSWMVFEVEGKNIQLFPEHERVRVFRRFESFLTGLAFHVQFLSQTEQIDAQTAPALLKQKEALTFLAATPRLHALQQASVQMQEQQMTTCTRTRHFLVVSVSSMEAALQNPEGNSPSVLSAIRRLLTFKKTPEITQSQVLDQLRIRASLVRKAIQHLDMRIWPLQDQEVVALFARCLAPGSREPTFVPELIDEQLWSSLHRQKQPLVEGPLNPQELLQRLGREAAQQYLINEVQRVYKGTGVVIHNKHLEVIVRQMFRSVAASFQDMSRVLAHAALQKQRDDLVGLKEKLVIGASFLR